MNTALVLILALAAYAPAQAQIFRSPVFGGPVLGAIIGHNSGSLGHNAWRGAAYGAGAGYLLGSIAENNARHREVLVGSSAPVATAASAQPQQVTVINNYYNAPATPMS